MIKYIKINSVDQIKGILDTIDTEDYSLVNYIWTEYGFLALMFNEMFIDYFKSTGPKIGFCFPGHEIFYEKYVDILVTLEGFIDTTKAYQNNKETELLLNNFKNISDRGIAFWYTVRNFDEDEYVQSFSEYTFKNVMYPIGKDLHWQLGWPIGPGYKYAEGEDGEWYTTQTEWNRKGTADWDLNLWDSDFIKDKNFNLGIENFNCFFVKNSWKTRKHNSQDINDLLVSYEQREDNRSEFGFIGLQLYNDIVDYHIKNKKHLVIINDLVRFPLIENEYIHYVELKNFLDVRLLMTISDQSDNFISSGTGPQDLSLYYSNTNQVIVTDSDFICGKIDFFEKIQNKRNKKCFLYDMRKDNLNSLLEFLSA
jgi:hypothetical protein